MELIANPLKVGVLVGSKRIERGRQQAIVLLQGFQDRAGRQIQLGQPAAVVLHLFDEFESGQIVRQDPRCGPGRDGGQRGPLLRLEAHFLQACQEAAVDLIGLRLQESGEPLEMKAKLVA